MTAAPAEHDSARRAVVVRLEAAFRGIERERMQGMPILNPALQVEAVGFSRWDGCWLGVLITPWFMNLMLLPEAPDRWETLPPGDIHYRRFPSGEYRFVAGFEEEIGHHDSCSLYSPVLEFADQDSARATAGAALQALLAEAGGASADCAPSATVGTGLRQRLAAPMSKRDFLFGRFLRGG